MKFSTKAAIGAALLSATTAFAQDSVCDKYTKAIFTDNTGANQYKLLVKIVNTALIGNYTPGAKNVVTGILVPGEVNGKAVNLLPYFNGGFVSTNAGKKAASVNFIDGGGAIPLAADMPASDTTSKQYTLVTHLYQYFGALLQCSMYGTSDFPAYGGSNNQYEVHKYMNLDINEMTYFITQVGAAATSFGASTDDVTAVGQTLLSTFAQRCAPAAVIIPSSAPDLQAICINSDCPEATSSPVCSKYNKRNGVGVQPSTATSTPGPQLSALAAQLSTIDASIASGSSMSYTSSVETTTVSGKAVTTTVAVPIAGGVALTTGTVTISSGSSVQTSTFTSTVTGAGGAGGIVVSTGTTLGEVTISSGSSVKTSSYTSTFVTSGSLSEIMTSVAETTTSGSSTFTTSVATTEDTLVPISVGAVTSVITSGSMTMTTVFTTTAVATGGAAGGGGSSGGAAATTTSKAAGVPLKVQGGILAVAGLAAAAMA